MVKATVCDRCGNPAKVDDVTSFRKKSYDLCSACADRLESFMKSKTSPGRMSDRVNNVFDELRRVD